MPYVVLIAAGFIVGLVVGRWWILLLSVGVGVWAGLSEEVEVPGVVIGVPYGGLCAIGLALGVLVRRRAGRDAQAD